MDPQHQEKFAGYDGFGFITVFYKLLNSAFYRTNFMINELCLGKNSLKPTFFLHNLNMIINDSYYTEFPFL